MEKVIYSIIFLIGIVGCYQDMNNKKVPRTKRMSSFNRPSFSMFMHSPMSLPGMRNSPISDNGHSEECITEDIVCPAWCLKEDDRGCKSCPCGPANGREPPVMETHSREDHSEKQNDCMGTILCMLSCKDGYELGPTQNDGCQSCTCVKKTVTKQKLFTTTIRTTSTTSSSSNGMHSIDHNNVPTPPTFSLPTTTTTATPTSTRHIIRCPITDVCIQRCQYTVKLGKPGRDGCPTCTCIISTTKSPIKLSRKPTTTQRLPVQQRICEATIRCMTSCKSGYHIGGTESNGCPSCHCLHVITKPTPQAVLTMPTPAPTKKSCPEVIRCMTSCRHGYQIQSSKYDTSCQICQCVRLLTPPPPTTTRRPAFIDLLHECSDAVHCMRACTDGYTLTTANGGEGCPKCTCNIVQRVPTPMSIPTVPVFSGTRCLGPACSAMHGIVSVNQPSNQSPPSANTLRSAMQACPATVKCMANCAAGYILSSVPRSSCPICTCKRKAFTV